MSCFGASFHPVAIMDFKELNRRQTWQVTTSEELLNYNLNDTCIRICAVVLSVAI